MREFNLQDTLRVSDSAIKGFVVMEREDGTTVFAKPNMIVENGRNYIKDLVFNQVATTTMDTRKFSHIRFGSGMTATSPMMTDLETHIAGIADTNINITDKTWSEYLGNDTPEEDYNNQSKWFNETTNTLYTLVGPGIWDNGTILPTTAPSGSFSIGTRWFNETNNTLYTSTIVDSWTDATVKELVVAEPEFLSGDIYYNDKNLKLYEYMPVLTVLPVDNAIGLKITIDVIGTTGVNESSSELGLFLVNTTTIPDESLEVGKIYQIKTLGTTNWNTVFGTTGITYVIGDIGTVDDVGSGTGDAYEIELFSRVVFDPIPITDTFKYKLTYYIYF